MTRLLSALAAILLLAGLVSAQTKPGEAVRLKLKSDEVLEGTVKLVDEEGVKLDIGDGIELYIRWAFTRGDQHFDLRKGVTDFSKIDSILKLADFCHEFAMDEQEARILVEALKLDPMHREARDRVTALPMPADVKIPPLPGEVERPNPAPDTGPRPDTPVEKPAEKPAEEPKEPPATRGPWTVIVEFENNDAAAVEWMRAELDKMNYKIGSPRKHEIRIHIDLTLTLVRNPSFMGSTLYAIYDGKLSWQLFKKDEKTAFARDTSKVEGVRRDTKAQAQGDCRTALLEGAWAAMHREMEKLR
jgi:hypothetical protein